MITKDQLVQGARFTFPTVDGDIILALEVLENGRCFLKPEDGTEESPCGSIETMCYELNLHGAILCMD